MPRPVGRPRASKPEVRYISYHTGGVPKPINASTPAEIADMEGFAINGGVSIFLDDVKVTANEVLTDNAFVSFQRSELKSGL